MHFLKLQSDQTGQRKSPTESNDGKTPPGAPQGNPPGGRPQGDGTGRGREVLCKMYYM